MDRPFAVISPHNIMWAHKFKTENAAWGRIMGLKRIDNTIVNRGQMGDEGWRVRDLRIDRK